VGANLKLGERFPKNVPLEGNVIEIGLHSGLESASFPDDFKIARINALGLDLEEVKSISLSAQEIGTDEESINPHGGFKNARRVAGKNGCRLSHLGVMTRGIDLYPIGEQAFCKRANLMPTICKGHQEVVAVVGVGVTTIVAVAKLRWALHCGRKA
jgi:hypothetical protein